MAAKQGETAITVSYDKKARVRLLVNAGFFANGGFQIANKKAATVSLNQDELKPLIEAIVKQVLLSKPFKSAITSIARQVAWDLSTKRERESKSVNGFATVKQASEFLSVSIDTIYRMVDDGSIESKRIRDAIRIPWAAIRKNAGTAK